MKTKSTSPIPSKISAYIIAFNELEKISAAINSVKWADEIIVADSGSTDGMIEKAEDLGAKVIQIPFEGFGRLRNSAIEKCSGDWIFSLDADERCTEAVRDEILSIAASPDSLDIYKVPRRNFFMGRWIKHSGWYPNFRQPQLFKNGSMSYTLEPVHEGFISHSPNPIGVLKNAIWQVPFTNLEQVIHKANRYSTLGVEKLEERSIKPNMLKAFYKASWSFIKHYIFKHGFLDGWPGFVIAFGNFEGTFYKYSKLQAKQLDWHPPQEKELLEKPITRD